jgi:hypothetical protein
MIDLISSVRLLTDDIIAYLAIKSTIDANYFAIWEGFLIQTKITSGHSVEYTEEANYISLNNWIRFRVKKNP